MKDIKPLGDRVLVKVNKEENKPQKGIIIPDSVSNNDMTATVIAVGEGRLTESNIRLPVPVKPGDIILMDKYKGQEITVNGEVFIIANTDDIIAILY